MRRILSIISLSSFFLHTSYADPTLNNSFYLGGQLSYLSYSAYYGSALHSRLIPLTGIISPIIGYQFTSSLALEAGYYNVINDYNPGGYVDTFGVQGPDHYRLFFYNLSGKWMIPIGNNFEFYAKAGGAYVHQDVFNQPYLALKPSAQSNVNQLTPLAGLGLDYIFNPHVMAEVGMTHVQGVGDVGNLDFLAFGLFYHF